ncbi:SdiA-regulated family protein [Pedobacter lusitanus]|uniref:SdiA-regulated family protein n=1 Tax=Pedobacter lusitanus TaxID=1503925 RepID=A0A0D0GWF0_9SPHI|nr:SdiA-regulated family protein [Pedobacter lusitanus]KIO78756.1 SdiA-regulated family protein [Pedobacter lusitanus]
MKLLLKKLNYIFPVLILIGFYACKPAKQSYTSPKGYDFNHPEKFTMPESLHEISGIAFYKGKSDTVYSIQDEEGRLFRQAWGNKKQKHAVFAKKGDYEDLAILNETFIILRSDGTLYTFPFSEATKDKVANIKEWNDILPDGEYESIYADQQTNQVYLLCKNCKEDKKEKTMSGSIFTYNPAKKELIASGNFSMDLTPLIDKGLILKTGLKASALTRDPHSGDWYILSSVNKLLVVASPDWKVKGVHRLNSSIFIQPEGLAFDNQMNLYISNEGDELSSGNILKFARKP